MGNELENLRPEVREALAICEIWLPDSDDDGYTNAWYTIRAELLRLTDENAQLRDVLADRDMDREMAAQANKRAAHAEAELAAVRARIAEGVYMGYPVECYVGNRCGRLTNPFTPAEWIGKRVRLLVDEPPAKENNNG